jgi:hypothetical protein
MPGPLSECRGGPEAEEVIRMTAGMNGLVNDNNGLVSRRIFIEPEI